MTYYYYKIKNMNVTFIAAPNAASKPYPIQPAGIQALRGVQSLQETQGEQGEQGLQTVTPDPAIPETNENEGGAE